MNRILQAHKGRLREAGGLVAGGSCRDEMDCPDKFQAEYAPEGRMEYEESVPTDRRPTLLVADILGAGRPEQSWDRAPGAGYLRPAASDRCRGIGDLGMAGLHIGAPARLQRGGRAAQPGGFSTPLVRNPGGLLFRTFSGSSARVDYRRRLELNTQDSDEDVLFRQEMRYPERGAGGFSNIRRAGGGESRAFPPVQLPEEQEQPSGSESASERGRSELRRSPEDRFSAGREEARAGAGHEGSEPVNQGGEGRGPLWKRSTLGRSGRGRRLPMRPRHSASAPLPLRGPQCSQLPRRGESMQHPRCDRYDSQPTGYGGAVPRQPHAQAGGWARQPAPPVVGLGLEAMQGMTNAMNAIADQVICNSGKAARNAGWPYFNGTYRDYAAFKRKFASYQANYHYATPSRELVQQFREMCLLEKIAARIKSAETMEVAWRKLDARFKDQSAFIKDLMQEIRNVSMLKDGEDERLMDYYAMLQSYIEEANNAGLLGRGDGASAPYLGEEGLERATGAGACS